MAWAFIEYPWEVLLENRQVWNSFPEFLRPDNGAGILFENEEVLPASTRVLRRAVGSVSHCEIAGPSLREDGFRDFAVKIAPGEPERILEYHDVSASGPAAPSAQFHDNLTNSLQEFTGILLEERKNCRDEFYEKPLSETLKHFFNTRDDDFAFRALICEIAEEMVPVIDVIVKQPRKVLQRFHTQVGLDRLQEMDVTSLMDYARRPGETALLKAGDRQRLMAVVREETANTLENRVVKDFCRRARKAAELYVKECCSKCTKKCNPDARDVRGLCCSKRVRTVESFVRRCDQWLMASEFSHVGTLPIPCRIPNYALLQNVRYVKVWDYYQRLLRQEDVRDQTWCWKRQSWTDYVRILMMQVMSDFSLDGKPASFRASRKPVRLRKDPEYGTWLKKEPFDGPIVFERDNHFISLYLLNRDDVDRLFDDLPEPLASLNADLYWVAVSTDWPELRVVPVWAFVGDARWHGNDVGKLRDQCMVDIKAASRCWQKKAVNANESPCAVCLSRLVVVKPFYSEGSTCVQKNNVVFIETPLTKIVTEVCEQISTVLREVLS